jgi:hypothetical protein
MRDGAKALQAQPRYKFNLATTLAIAILARIPTRPVATADSLDRTIALAELAGRTTPGGD